MHGPLLIWLQSFTVFAALASIVQTFDAPEVRESRAHCRAVQLANEELARRQSRRTQSITR